MILRALAQGLQRRDGGGWWSDPSAIPPNSAMFPPSWSGVPVSERTALQQLAVWACVSVVADSIAMLPAAAFERDGAARKTLAVQPRFLDEPNAEMEWIEFVHMLLASLLLRGNGYARVIERDRMGFATQYFPLHPDECEPRRNMTTNRIEYRVHGEKEPLSPLDVVHIKGLRLPGVYSLKGLSPIEYARQTIGLAIATEQYGARYFGEGTHPSGVLESDQPLDRDAAKLQMQLWIEAQGGNHRYPAILGSGLKWKPMAVPPNESQFLQSREFNAVQISGFYRVPPHKIGLTTKSTSWGSGLEELNQGFITDGLQMWITRIEKAFSRRLPRPHYMKLNVAGLLRGRTLERYKAYELARNAGWLNVDEIRALEEYEPLPNNEGKDYLQPLNYKPIGSQDTPPSQPPPSGE